MPPNRSPDWDGWLHFEDDNAQRTSRRVQLWESSNEPAGPDEYHGYLQIDGYRDYDTPRPCPGATPFQATAVTWAHLNSAITSHQKGHVSSNDDV